MNSAGENTAALEKAIEQFDLNAETSSNKGIELDLTKPTFIGLKSMGEGGKVVYQPDFYSDAIQKLAQASDMEAGIIWKIDEENNTIIRDAREAKGLEQNSIYGQLATAFNSCRAADRMIRIGEEGIRADHLQGYEPKRVEAIRTLVKTIADGVANGNVESIDLNALNRELVSILRGDVRYKGQSDKALLKKMNVTKDLACLEDRKYNICTIYNQQDNNGEKRVVFEGEAIIPPISDEKLKDSGFKQKVIDAQKNPFNGNMVTAYFPALTAQETIPTQCLGTLPGVRNGYVKVIGEVKTENKRWSKSIHTGTVSSVLKIDGDENYVARDNVAHIANNTPFQEQGVIFTTLNTPIRTPLLYAIPVIGWIIKIVADRFATVKKENNAYYQLDAAVKSHKGQVKVKRALTPLNKMRVFGGQKIAPYDEALKELGSSIVAEHQAVGRYLQGIGSEKEAYASLKDINNPIVKAALNEAIRTKSAVNESFIGGIFRTVQPDDKGMSRSLRQTAGMIALTSLVNSGVLGESIKMPVIAYHCKSGKDRTGAVSIEANRRSMNVILGITADSEIARENLKKQLNAGHTAKLAEIGGGTPGAIGIRPNPGIESADIYKNLLEKICLRTSKNNKIDKVSQDGQPIVVKGKKQNGEKTKRVLISIKAVPPIALDVAEEAAKALETAMTSQVTQGELASQGIGKNHSITNSNFT